MSDHVDGPRSIGDPAADLTDLFAFTSPKNPAAEASDVQATVEASDVPAIVLRPRPKPYRGEYVVLRIGDAVQGREMLRHPGRGQAGPPGEFGGRGGGTELRQQLCGVRARMVSDDDVGTERFCA